MAMNYYFQNLNSRKLSGRPTTTLPNLLLNEIKMLKNDMNNGNQYKFTKFKSIDDLRNLRLLAGDRKRWSTLVKDMYDPAKAEKDS